ncbi:MAG: 4-(cytidine 5'-diphospho)-2-C-methyl-D-erythritol kinase, partial [Parvibaculales bacterium]
MLRLSAPAKINLSLKVLGRRDDGYHILESLVAFADIGDQLILEKAENTNFEVSGPFAVSAGEDN